MGGIKEIEPRGGSLSKRWDVATVLGHLFSFIFCRASFPVLSHPITTLLPPATLPTGEEQRAPSQNPLPVPPAQSPSCLCTFATSISTSTLTGIILCHVHRDQTGFISR